MLSITKGLACRDYNFCKYKNDLITHYEDNEDSNIIPNLLIVHAVNKYKALKQIGQ